MVRKAAGRLHRGLVPVGSIEKQVVVVRTYAAERHVSKDNTRQKFLCSSVITQIDEKKSYVT